MNGLDVIAGVDRGHGVGVSEIVKAKVFNAGITQGFLQHLPDTALRQMSAEFVGEYQIRKSTVVPCCASVQTLFQSMQMLGTDLQAHRVNYNNNPILKWCLTNTGIQTDRNGNIVPVKNQSPKQRIDGTAALLDCYVGLYEHYNEFTGAI